MNERSRPPLVSRTLCCVVQFFARSRDTREGMIRAPCCVQLPIIGAQSKTRPTSVTQLVNARENYQARKNDRLHITSLDIKSAHIFGKQAQNRKRNAITIRTFLNWSSVTYSLMIGCKICQVKGVSSLPLAPTSADDRLQSP